MSLNKWKVWPVEILEDVLKIDKKLVTMKRGYDGNSEDKYNKLDGVD